MEYTQIGLIVIVVIAICQAIKVAGLPSRFVPLLAIALSVGAAFYFEGANILATVGGVILGLASSGLFDVFKKTLLNK